jgi:CBS domain-containing protein
LTNVSSVMSKSPINADESTPLSHVIALMVKHRVGSVVVVNQKGVPSGVITERELLRDIAGHARVSEDARADSIMSLSILTIPPDMKVEDAARASTKNGLRLVVTKRNGVLEGVVSTSDLLRFFAKTGKDVPIEDRINRKVLTLDARRGVLDAIELMSEKRIGSVVITNAGLPCGMITERDLLRILAKKRKKDFGTLLLDNIATKPLISAPYGVMAREASSIMLQNKIKRLPIFKGEKLVGIVTARDLVRAYSAGIEKRAREREIFNIT